MHLLDRARRKLRTLTGRTAGGDLDDKLAAYLNFRDGFFVEAGANDGVDHSTTYYLEKRRGWRGLLIEPIPELARRCAANRRRSIVENCALVPFSFAEKDIAMRYCNLMSIVKGGMKTPQEELDHIAKGCEIQRIQMYDLRVPACTLTALLTKHHVQRIDFFCLDVEGYELPALQGVDFTRYRPTYMLIEARYRQEIDEFLQPWYSPVAVLSELDVLYQLRVAP